MSEIVKKRIKPSTIVLFISLLPYLLPIVYGVYCAFDGFTFVFTTTYGFDAFMGGVIFSALYLAAIVPVIPVCLIYQGFYVVRGIVKGAKTVAAEKYWLVCAAACAIAALLLLMIAPAW